MQIFVPDLYLTFVPITMNADRHLSSAIQRRWPTHWTVSHLFPGKRVVMWRNPQERFEATYFERKRIGIEEDFNKWAYDVLTTGLRDANLKPQVDFCDNPYYFFRWDFSGLNRTFRIKDAPPAPDIHEVLVWEPRVVEAFSQAYKADLSIWGEKFAPITRMQDIPPEEKNLGDSIDEAQDHHQEAS
jgi:hypothetical protein